MKAYTETRIGLRAWGADPALLDTGEGAMNGFRWIGSVFACAVLTLVLAGCSGEEKVPEGFTVITVWAHQGQARENMAMRAIVDAFNQAYQDEKLMIDITFFPDRQYADKVSIASASGSLPDVLDIDGPFVGPWAAEGLLIPIDSYVDTQLREDMLASLIEQGTYNKKLYALGAFDSALVVYYNRDVMEKADLDPPELVDEAWTWQEFTDALEKVKPHVPIALSLHMNQQSDEWFTYAFTPLVWSNGGALIDTANGRIEGVMNGAATAEAITEWKALFENGYAQATSPTPDPFSAQQSAFDWNGHWMLPTFEETEGLHFGAMPLPRMGDIPVAASGSWCWGLSRNARDPKTAWKAIEWFLDPKQGIQPIVEANGAVPGRKSAFQYFPEYDTMPQRLFREQLELAAHPRPRTPVYLTLTTEFARALRDIAKGADVEARLTEAAETVQQTYDRRYAKEE
jgi:ABC-type glycerol-3-phosphate transport system substrate-binding protein